MRLKSPMEKGIKLLGETKFEYSCTVKTNRAYELDIAMRYLQILYKE